MNEVEILQFTKKGNGLGTTSGETVKQVEVPFTLPGEKVRALLRRKKGGAYSSQLEEILIPSPLRIAPRCVHFAVCGGCRWQHMSYWDQLKIKQEKIQSLFAPLLPSGIDILPIVPCDPPWQYRNKMEFSFSEDISGNKYLGLIMDNSRGKVLNLTECHLVNPWFIQALKAVKAWWGETDLQAYHPHADKGSLRTLIMREGMRTGDRLVMLTVSGRPEYALQKHHLESLVAFLQDAVEPVDPSSTLTIFLRIQQAVKGMETNFYEMLLYGPDHIREILNIQTAKEVAAIPLTFDISPSAFFQPNTKQAEKLYSLALQMLEVPSDSIVYDLYCGTGTLGICAAKQAKRVIGIEISPESSLDARTNAAKNRLSHVEIITGAVRDVLKQKTLPLPDIVMVDPPRSGLDADTIKHLIDLSPQKILYISCNPETQAENVKELQKAGYVIKAVQPVDQFPQTVHIENIMVLHKFPT
jgi:23S rRNA (uracil1939-C5)-methyltransferase